VRRRGLAGIRGLRQARLIAPRPGGREYQTQRISDTANITGAVSFLGSVGTAFTGYLVQQNFDSQWISTQAKDGLNSVGIGAFFNVTDFGQMLMWHIVLLPAVVGIIVVLHILMVRRRGVVPPIPLAPAAADDSSAAADVEQESEEATS
jgi:ubiquinol-cytochrome c reductase cytochrome b subunit